AADPDHEPGDGRVRLALPTGDDGGGPAELLAAGGGDGLAHEAGHRDEVGPGGAVGEEAVAAPVEQRGRVRQGGRARRHRRTSWGWRRTGGFGAAPAPAAT